MKYYRVEANPSNIGTVLETPFSLSPMRLRIANNQMEWQLLSKLVDISIAKNLSLHSVCRVAVAHNFEIAGFLSGIWEVLFERAKPKEIPLRRTECAFFFENKDDALKYMAFYPKGLPVSLCEVEIINEIYSLRADMNWLESIDENTVTAEEAIGVFKKYWAGEMTQKPVVELLFIGKYKLNPEE